jgi:predicted 2-oxoglutarate/Fe(II)-dependent dioxygenase YbiX
MIRESGEWILLFDPDVKIQRLNAGGGDQGTAIQLTGVYHNLRRHPEA